MLGRVEWCVFDRILFFRGKVRKLRLEGVKGVLVWVFLKVVFEISFSGGNFVEFLESREGELGGIFISLRDCSRG